MDQPFRKYNRNSRALIIRALTVTLSVKLTHQSFPLTLRKLMKHHHTEFGHKGFSDSENIGRTNIHLKMFEPSL